MREFCVITITIVLDGSGTIVLEIPYNSFEDKAIGGRKKLNKEALCNSVCALLGMINSKILEEEFGSKHAEIVLDDGGEICILFNPVSDYKAIEGIVSLTSSEIERLIYNDIHKILAKYM